jgi:murein L,D-transpeptidase YafK
MTLALPLAVGGTVVASTWHTFPGAWLGNRLNLSGNKLQRAQERGALLLEQLGLAQSPRSLSIVIRKADRRLTLFGDGRELLKCRVGLGGSPVGQKARRGDSRTPEGEYRVCSRNPNSQFHLFLGLSYPNETDADRGLVARLISPAEHRALVSAARDGRKPSWDTALGGTVGIHGSGANWDWTLGCIALDDADIETLWALCPIGTPVRIEP